MDPIKFSILPGTDKEYFDAIEALRTSENFPCERLTFGPIADKAPSDLAKDVAFHEVLNQGMRVFPLVSFHISQQFRVQIKRNQELTTPFDEVTVSSSKPDSQPIQFAKLVANLQKLLGQTSLTAVGNLLGPGAKEHFEAREVALARLEKMAANLMQEMESTRKQREQELDAKEQTLKKRYDQKLAELETDIKSRKDELEKRSSELESLKKELDDRAAKHARRQHYKDIKEKFKSWNEKFEVTLGTSNLRRSGFWFTLFLIVLTGCLAGRFLLQSITVQETPALIAAIVKQITFTVLFVSFSIFFIRWNNQWFQRHADEEFRLKRMELDIDRASWFVEMAFEWKDEKGEAIPVELIERLTHGLFIDEGGSPSVEPADSLAQALLGAARFKVKMPNGTELEYDRKGIKELLKRNEDLGT